MTFSAFDMSLWGPLSFYVSMMFTVLEPYSDNFHYRLISIKQGEGLMTPFIYHGEGDEGMIGGWNSEVTIQRLWRGYVLDAPGYQEHTIPGDWFIDQYLRYWEGQQPINLAKPVGWQHFPNIFVGPPEEDE